jgi:hypothetical protein
MKRVESSLSKKKLSLTESKQFKTITATRSKKLNTASKVRTDPTHTRGPRHVAASLISEKPVQENRQNSTQRNNKTLET